MNSVFTWIDGNSFCELKEIHVFLNSLKQNVESDVFVFTNEISDKMREIIYGLNFNLVEIKDPVVCVVRDRFYYYWKYVVENKLQGNLLHVDSKDVLFQSDPFKFNCEKSIFLIEEGMKHEQSPWNMRDQHRHQRQLNSFHSDWRTWNVLNAGVMYGDANKLANLFFLIWSNLLTVKNESGTDQAVLNYLYHEHLFLDENIKIAPKNFCLTGESIVYGFVTPELEDFCIFHQWDRTEFKEEILKKWAQ